MFQPLLMTWTPGTPVCREPHTMGSCAVWVLQVGWRCRPAPALNLEVQRSAGERETSTDTRALLMNQCSWFNPPAPCIFWWGSYQPPGYWEHSVSLGGVNLGGEDLSPAELRMASSLAPLRLGCHLCAGSLPSSAHQQFEPLPLRAVWAPALPSDWPMWWPECTRCLLGLGHRGWKGRDGVSLCSNIYKHSS